MHAHGALSSVNSGEHTHTHTHTPLQVLLLRRLAKESGGVFRVCVEDGTVHDELHADGVSWSTDTVQVLRRSAASSSNTHGDLGADLHQGRLASDGDGNGDARRDKPNHYFEVLEWVRLGKYDAAEPGPELDDSKPKICLCDGDDQQLLRVELEKGAR